MADENKKFNVSFTKSGLSDYILQEILKKSSVEDGLSELKKTNSKIEQRIKKVVEELENNEIIANKVSNAIENVQLKTFGKFDNIKNQFTVTGKNYKKLLVEINKSLNSKELSDVNASSKGYQVSMSSFASKVEKSYEEYKEKLKELAEQSKKQEAEAKKQEAALKKFLSARNVKTLDELKVKTEAATKEGNDLLRQFTTSTNKYMESLSNSVGGTIEEVNEVRNELFNSNFLGVSDKPLSKSSVKKINNKIAKSRKLAEAEKKRAAYDKKIQDAANKVTPLSSKAVSEEYRNRVIENATENTKVFKQGLLGAFYPVEDNPHKLYVNTYRRKRLARLGSIGQLEVLPDGRVLSVHRDKNNNRIDARFIGGTSRQTSAQPTESEFGNVLGSAGTGPQSQSDVIDNAIGSSDANKPNPLGTVVPKNKPKTDNKKDQTNSFQSQQQKSYDRQRQKAFLALLIPALQKILRKNTIVDLIKLAMLMFGKKHPVLATAGLMLAPGLFPALLANKALGNPIGKIFGGFYNKFIKPSAIAKPFRTANRLLRRNIHNFNRELLQLPKNIKNMKPGEWFKNWKPSEIAKASQKGINQFKIGVSAARGLGFKETVKTLFTKVPKTPLTNAKSYGTLLKGMKRMAPLTKGLKRVPYLGALISAAFEIPDLINAKKAGRLKRQILTSSLKVGGSLGGAAAGGAGGAALGGLIGTIFGPVGTAIGGAIGGVVGAIAGGIFGEKAAIKIDNALDDLCSIFKKFGAKIQNLLPWLFGNQEQKDINTQKDNVKKAQEKAAIDAETARKGINSESAYLNELDKKDSRSYKGLVKRYQKAASRELTDKEIENLINYERKKHEKMKAYYKHQLELANAAKKSADDAMKVVDEKANTANAKNNLNALGSVSASGMLTSAQAKSLSPEQLAGVVAQSKAYEKIQGKKGYWTIENASFGKYSGNPGGSTLNGDVLYNQKGSQAQIANLMDMGYIPKGAIITSALASKSSNHNGHGSGLEFDIKYGKASDWEAAVKGFQRAKKDGLISSFLDEYHQSVGTTTGKNLHFAVKDLATGKGSIDEQLQKTIAAAKAASASTPAATGTSSAGAGYNVVSESEIWDAVKARTGGTTGGHTDKVRNLIFSSTDVTGSLGVFGITQWNNTGHKKGA